MKKPKRIKTGVKINITQLNLEIYENENHLKMII